MAPHRAMTSAWTTGLRWKFGTTLGRLATSSPGGRIQHAVDSRPLEKLVLRAAHGFATDGPPVSARVCESLQEASTQPYFYEAMLKSAQQPIPYGEGYEAWRRERAKAMEAGQEIYFLGLASK